ncbi:hypothetical protein [Planctomicrobium sp. SH664]|uniref:hypothetical protein n=1 Tax=Planctomicrobium sp. SH664 TaxID=3448125 RepID=UPI003F5B0862
MEVVPPQPVLAGRNVSEFDVHDGLLLMRLRHAIIVCLTILAVRATPGFGSESVPQLIRQLGHPQFEQRVAAQRQLLELGVQSMQAVGDAAQSDDPEVRHRSRMLLDQLQKMAFTEQADWIRENPWQAAPSIAPHWEFYHGIVGDGPAARNLYVRMIQKETDLWMLTVRVPEGWGSALEQRCLELRTAIDRRNPRELDLASVATVVLLATHPRYKASPIAVDTIDKLLTDQRVTSMIEKSPEVRAMHGLIGHWVGSEVGSSLMSRMEMSRRFNLEVGFSVAEEVLAARHGAQNPQLTREAVDFLAKRGGESAIEVLHPLIEDGMVLSRSSRVQNSKGPGVVRPPDLQLGDVALYALVQLTGQKAADYGFLDRRSTNASNAANFPTIEARAAAIQKWKSWSTFHLRGDVVESYPRDASEGTGT